MDMRRKPVIRIVRIVDDTSLVLMRCIPRVPSKAHRGELGAIGDGITQKQCPSLYRFRVSMLPLTV
jgi:hypothetical protein